MSKDEPVVVTLPYASLGEPHIVTLTSEMDCTIHANNICAIQGARWPIVLCPGEKVAIRATPLGLIPSDE